MKPKYRENSSGVPLTSPTGINTDTQPPPESSLKESGQTIEQLKKTVNDLKLLNINPSEITNSETPKIPLKSVQRTGSLSRGVLQKPSEKPLNSAKRLSAQFKSTDLLSKKPDEMFLSTDRATPSKLEEKPHKRSSSKPPEISNEITTSLKSQEVLANKFIKEFQSFLPGSESIDFPTALNLLKNLRFIQNDPTSKKHEDELNLAQKLWKLINGEDTVKVQNLLCICLNIMNLYSPSGHMADTTCTQVRSWLFLHNMFVYNSEEALKIHKMFYEFYQNRRLAPKKTENQEPAKEEKAPARSRYGSLQKKEKREESVKKEAVLKTEPEEGKKQPIIQRAGSKKRPEVSLRSPVVKIEPKKIPLGIRKEIDLISDFSTPKLDRLKTEPVESQSVKSLKGMDFSKKKVGASKVTIFHKKSSSFASESFPIQGLHKKQSSDVIDLANIAEPSYTETTDLCSPATSSSKYFKNTFEEDKESDSDEVPLESLGLSESTGKIPILKPNSHAAALQLINFINDHNLSEDSAEQLLQIFKMNPKSNG